MLGGWRPALRIADHQRIKAGKDEQRGRLSGEQAAQAMYANASAAGASAPQGGGSSQGSASQEESDEEVVEDAEYEVVDE